MYSKYSLENNFYTSFFNIPDLPADIEKTLIIKAQNNDQKALDKVLLHNYKYILHVVKPCYTTARFDENDLFQEGAIALIRAIETYDPETGTKFSSYAINKIRKYVSKYITRHSGLLKVPVYLKELLKKVKKIEEQYLMEKDYKFPVVNRISREMNIPESAADKYYTLFKNSFMEIKRYEE